LSGPHISPHKGSIMVNFQELFKLMEAKISAAFDDNYFWIFQF
jgi:hypothetical protein